MSETPSHEPAAGREGHGDHHEPSLKTYQVVFGALLIFTVVSFISNFMANHHVISHGASFAIILGVAVCKATLVGVYFMHLIMDWSKVFVMIVPALILGPMFMMVLLPDIVLAWWHAVIP